MPEAQCVLLPVRFQAPPASMPCPFGRAAMVKPSVSRCKSQPAPAPHARALGDRSSFRQRGLCFSWIGNCRLENKFDKASPQRQTRPGKFRVSESAQILRRGIPVVARRIAGIAKLPLTHCFCWCPHTDSNRRPSDYKSDALPTEL